MTEQKIEARDDLKIIISKPVGIEVDAWISFEDEDSFNLPDQTADYVYTIPEHQSMEIRGFYLSEKNVGRKLVFKISATQNVEKVSVEVFFDFYGIFYFMIVVIKKI